MLIQYLSRYYSAFFRQTFMADFEIQAHALAEEGKPLTAQLLGDLYRATAERYYGTPGMVVDDIIACEWSRIPHFYYNFYVYQYATGIAASTALAQAVFTEGKPATERYLTLLRSGVAGDSIKLLQRAGVDMMTPAPIEAALQEFDRLVLQLENEIDPTNR